MTLKQIEFPATIPDGVDVLDDEPGFVPSRHLQFEASQEVYRLGDFGYSDDEIARCPSDVAVAGPFRILSDEGASAMLDVSRRLKVFKQRSERASAMVRYPAYRSKFIRDLARSSEVAGFVGDQLEAELVPSALTGLALSHFNYAPDELGEAIDEWHHDIVGIDYVMAASDPRELDGGRFEFFTGTKAELSQMQAAGQGVPRDRVVAVEYPGPGWATVQQGNMVVHRAAPLNQAAERTSFLVCYQPGDIDLDETNKIRSYTTMDPAHIVYPEWARHKAWLARAKIDRLLEELPFTDDRGVLIAALEDVRSEIDVAIDDIRDESVNRLERYDG
ncbi:MAG: hypothetical protein HOI34_07695 [Rhodospirillaceae bacterium]|jgi:hypothetical protein|nr:hypothetical protein [Rhodospirillaceae bacterium]MBT6511034.1 hypothetical protein [Rhodospirillaceae bacterium]MBT7613643.1 hypothetical protein [Rhodospirillaceae bacterium]